MFKFMLSVIMINNTYDILGLVYDNLGLFFKYNRQN